MATLTRQFAVGRSDEVALVDSAGETTWRQLDERVNRLVNGLRAAGLQPGDTIAVVVGNRREWFEIAMACAHGGWTYVPVDWHWVADELAYVFDDADVVAVIVDGRYADAVGAALADDRSRFLGYEDLLTGASTDEPEDQRLGGPMLYTSGTMGRPKGVRSALLGNSDLTPDVMQLPRSAAGKIQKRPLREPYWAAHDRRT